MIASNFFICVDKVSVTFTLLGVDVATIGLAHIAKKLEHNTLGLNISLIIILIVKFHKHNNFNDFFNGN